MTTFLKAQTSSLVATFVDYLVTIACVEVAGIPIVPAGIAGNISGAIVNFLVGRSWVFDPSGSSFSSQILKYGVVWLGYMILNAAGMFLFEYFTPLHYVSAKTIVGLTLAVTYNYFLQKKFVFN